MKIVKKEIDESIIRKVVKLKTKINDLQYEYDTLLEELKDEMVRNDIDNVDNKLCEISYVESHSKTRFDSKTFKEEHEKMYNKYLKDVYTKDSLRITLK